MRIAWCTPFAKRSRIGEFSAAVVTELRARRGIDVDIFYPLGAGGRSQPDRGQVLDGEEGVEQLRTYDAVFYNMGNHWGYHKEFLTLGAIVPGIAIVHDVSFTHLVTPELLKLSDRELEAELVRRYGSTGTEIAISLRADPVKWAWDPSNFDDHPLFSFVLENAAGVITHSHFAAARLKTEYSGEVWVLPLPTLHVPSDSPQGPSDSARTGLERLDDRPIVLQAGVINPTKCVPTLLDAFALADLAEQAQLVICGFAEPVLLEQLRQQVTRSGLDGSVHILGAVSDEAMDALRRRAKLATILRYPISEASSAALLDSLAYGLGVITTDYGHYREMPILQLRINYPPRPDDLANALRRGLAHPEETEQMGTRGREYVRSRHTARLYAEAIASIANEGGAIQRRKDLAADLATVITRAGFLADDPLCDAVATTVTQLYGGRPNRAAEIFRSDSEYASGTGLLEAG